MRRSLPELGAGYHRVWHVCDRGQLPVTANGKLAAILVAVLAVLGMVLRPGISDWDLRNEKAQPDQWAAPVANVLERCVEHVRHHAGLRSQTCQTRR